MLNLLGYLLLEAIIALAAKREAFQPAVTGIIVRGFSHTLGNRLFSSLYIFDFTVALRMLLGVQVLVAAASPGSRRVPGAVHGCGHALGRPSADVVAQARRNLGTSLQ